MRTILALLVLATFTACGSVRPKTPEQIESERQAAAQEAATERFEACMDRTLASVGPFRFGSQEARLKAAEICKDVMQSK